MKVLDLENDFDDRIRARMDRQAAAEPVRSATELGWKPPDPNLDAFGKPKPPRRKRKARAEQQGQ